MKRCFHHPTDGTENIPCIPCITRARSRSSVACSHPASLRPDDFFIHRGKPDRHRPRACFPKSISRFFPSPISRPGPPCPVLGSPVPYECRSPLHRHAVKGARWCDWWAIPDVCGRSRCGNRRPHCYQCGGNIVTLTAHVAPASEQHLLPICYQLAPMRWGAGFRRMLQSRLF